MFIKLLIVEDRLNVKKAHGFCPMNFVVSNWRILKKTSPRYTEKSYIDNLSDIFMLTLWLKLLAADLWQKGGSLTSLHISKKPLSS